MRALVFADFGRVELEDVPKPSIEEPTDVLLRVTTTAICGSDLHVVNGRIPGMTPGSILGHEFCGVVEEVGSAVTAVKEGDRVLASFTIPCGTCWYCKKGFFSRCPDQRVFGYGAFLGDVNGGQAEYVRVPNADLCLTKIDDSLADEQVLFAGDIFTTGLDAATEALIQPGDTVTILGCGPVGLMTIEAAKTFKPARIFAVDTVPERLAMAERLGGEPVNAKEVNVPQFVQDETGDRGSDSVIECVGAVPALLESLDIVRAGGRISVIGVHSEQEFEFPLNINFVKAIDLKFCGTANIVGRWQSALDLIRSGKVNPAEIISHRMSLDDAVKGYDMFDRREALKVVLTP